MNDLDLCIKRLNLIFTNTLSLKELRSNDIHFINEPVNYDNSISLYDFISSFHKLHLALCKEYGNLDKLNLGKTIRIGNLSKEDNSRSLKIYIDNPIINNDKNAILILVEEDGNIFSYITNDLNPFHKKYYRHEINLDKDKIKEYLDLFEKYYYVTYLYNNFKNGSVFSDGINIIFANMKSSRNYFLDYYQHLELSIKSNNFMESSDCINISISLGNSISLDIDHSKMEIYGKTVNANIDDYMKVLKNVYINERYLNTYWDRVDHKEKVSAKSLIKTIKSIGNH